ncbi:MAG TPA: hypothetical protein EYH22_02710 [Candidatus Nanopusillus sp.]|nr:hypothetical protein [Candidatus Nanopusillus sp.]
MEKMEVLEKLYNALKSIGRMDKVDVMRVLEMEPTDWNMRKALNYLKELANEYEDVELKQGKRGMYYVEWIGYKGLVKEKIKKSFDVESFEKDFWDNVYYLLISKISDNTYNVIEAMEVNDFLRIWKKYKLMAVGDWINLRLKENDTTAVDMEYVGYVFDTNKYKLFTKTVEVSEDIVTKLYKSKAKRCWRGCSKKGSPRYYNLIRSKNKLYAFEIDTKQLYKPKTGEIYLPGRVLVYDINDNINVDVILNDLEGCKRACSSLIYIVRDYNRIYVKSRDVARLKLMDLLYK